MGTFVVVVLVLLVLCSIGAAVSSSENSTKEDKADSIQREKQSLALDAYADFLARNTSNIDMAEMSATEIKHRLSTKLDSYRNTLAEVEKIVVPWYGGIQHVKGVDTKRAARRSELVQSIASDGFDLERIEELLGKKCSPVPLKGFIIRN